MKIDGKEISTQILENLKNRIGKLKEKKVIPHLYIITFGKNPQTESYLKQKILKADTIGAKITIKRFAQSISLTKVLSFVENLNKDKKVNGIIIQRPLPKNFEEEKISLAVVPAKDVDGFHPHSNFSTPVALAVLKMIESTIPHQEIHSFLKSKKIILIGKGITAGKPIIELFKKLKINTKLIDSKTKGKLKILKSADIIISSVGKKIIQKSEIKKGVILIGVGMHVTAGKLKGDFEEDEIKNKASYYSSTPGGVGPINVTMLMKNLVEAAEKQLL